jgi:hypothetical protein
MPTPIPGWIGGIVRGEQAAQRGKSHPIAAGIQLDLLALARGIGGAITMYVDPKTRTMATLYGNDAAMRAALARQPAPPGAVLALVTWAQRDDPHWFGARIPGAPQSVEFVQVAAAGQTSNYRRIAGTGLVEDSGAARAALRRTSFMLGLAPASLP